jgi:hypothetical protein
MKILLFTDRRNKVKKIKFVFIEYVPASKKLEEFEEVASFAPELMEVAQRTFKSYKKSLENSENDCYLGIQYQDGDSEKIM